MCWRPNEAVPLPFRFRGHFALEEGRAAGKIQAMDTRPHRPPPVLDMTPEGEFRTEPAPTRRGWLDRLLGRVGGVALLLTAGAFGLLLAALAVLFIGLLLPVVLVAGAVGFASVWWRLRRAARRGERPGGMRFVVIRR
jgi:hypothetical protein